MEDRDKLLGRLQDLCARAEHCSADIFQKAMKALDWDRVASQEMVDSLVKDGYIDDRRYAEAFARDKAQLTGWGPVKTWQMLLSFWLRTWQPSSAASPSMSMAENT